MDFDRLYKATTILRHRAAMTKAAGALKELAIGIDRGASKAAKHLSEKGHNLTAMLVRGAPYAGALYGGKQAYDRIRSKIDEIRYRRALRAQGYNV